MATRKLSFGGTVVEKKEHLEGDTTFARNLIQADEWTAELFGDVGCGGGGTATVGITLDQPNVLQLPLGARVRVTVEVVESLEKTVAAKLSDLASLENPKEGCCGGCKKDGTELRQEGRFP